MSFKALAFFDQKTYTIGVMAHQILPSQISCFAEGVKVNVFNGLKTKKKSRVMNIFLGFYKVQTLNVNL